MQLDADKMIERAMQDAIRDGVKQALTGHNSVLGGLLSKGIANHESSFHELINQCFGDSLKNEEFRETVKSEVRRALAKSLISRFGGEIERQVNALKRDPITRARITTAIDTVIRDVVKT